MATYKISYLIGESYSNKNSHYVDNVIDEYDAVEQMLNNHNLPSDTQILKVELVCE